MTDRQEYNYYDSPTMKDDMQNQGQKQNKKGYYNKYKEPMHKANTSGMMDDKSSMNSMGNDYQNYAKYRKNQGKKSGYNNYNNKGQNEDFDNKNFKKMKKKMHNRDMNSDYQYNTNPGQTNPIDSSTGYEQGANPQHQKNMYNNNKGYNKNKTGMYPNNPNQGGSNITPPRHNNQMNIPYGYTNPQQNEGRQPPSNQSQNVPSNGNTMQGFQGMTYPATQQNPNSNSNAKQNMQKGQNMLIHNTPNQNLMYMQQQMENDNENNNNQKEEKSSETTSEDNITQAQSMISNVQNPQMAMQPSPMMDNQSQSDTMSTSSNRHSTMTANPNPNQYMQNDMYLPKSFIQQQQYGHMPMGMYGMQNMMMMEHQNPQMFNQGVGMPPTQGMPNFPFGINEEGMKVHNKKMGKKMPSNKSPNDTPNGIVNMNPNMMGMNYPMPNSNPQNKAFYKPIGTNPNIATGSLNTKGSLSMQGNKNTVPAFNNVSLNFMMPGNPSPQSQRNNIPNMLNSNPNMNMSMPMSMNLGMGMNMNPQRQFYNPNGPTNPQGGNNNQQNNMNKRHTQNPYRTVNSDKNIIGNGLKPKEAFYQQNNQMNMNQKNNYKNQHFNNNQNGNNNQGNNQRMMHPNNRNEEWNNYPQMPQIPPTQNMMMNQGQNQMNIVNPNSMKQMMYGNMNDQNNNNFVSLYVRIKVAKDKEELIEIKYGEDPIVVQKTLSANPNVNVSDKLVTVIYQKIIRAINIRNNILSNKLSKYNMKKLIQLKHQISKKESLEGKSDLPRSNSFDNLKEKYNKYINDIKPMYEDVKKVELLNISQYN